MSSNPSAFLKPRAPLRSTCAGVLLTLPLWAMAAAAPDASFESSLATDDVATVWNATRADVQRSTASGSFSGASLADRVPLPAPVADPSVVITIPEPATWALMLAGVAAVGWLRRRTAR